MGTLQRDIGMEWPDMASNQGAFITSIQKVKIMCVYSGKLYLNANRFSLLAKETCFFFLKGTKFLRYLERAFYTSVTIFVQITHMLIYLFIRFVYIWKRKLMCCKLYNLISLTNKNSTQSQTYNLLMFPVTEQKWWAAESLFIYLIIIMLYPIIIR